MHTRNRFAFLCAAVTLVSAALVVLGGTEKAWAHGAMLQPGSRTYLCYVDGLTERGNIEPNNPACAAAVAESGPNSLYNWFGVLRSNGAGRTEGFIPDGQLCSGGNPSYRGFDLARDDWPVTHLTAGAQFNFTYNKWAAHPGWYYLYITKDSYNPNEPLGWDDLEPEPFLVADHPPERGATGTLEGEYYWTGQLPEGKSGRHIIYSVWERSDSAETFYGCSDVVFDGGNGEVTGIGENQQDPPTTEPPTTEPPADGGDGTAACTAEYTVLDTWQGGFKAKVTVTNDGSAPVNGWTVGWQLGTGQRISNVWSGELSVSGSAVTVSDAGWNGSLSQGGQASFGFVAGTSGDSRQPAGAISCASS